MSLQSAHRVMFSSVSNKKTPQTTIKPGTYRRIATFATRHKRKLIVFLALSVGTAVIGVLNPVLAGDVVNAITSGGPVETVVWLAVAIGGLAIADAGITIANRYLSSQIGEGLIFDLRTAVYDHVQKMPIAFFNRTRTGALVSRLNTDVIGAQRAFSNTLSGIVSNFVSLALTVGVMVTISWQVTVMSILLLPLFIIPTKLLSGRLASLQFQAADNTANMSTRMTERFSAGGATLIKLFGNPKTENEEFSDRAAQVRDIGVKVAMLQSTFVSSLTLVSALALALVYGIGGAQAVLGNLNAGQVVTLALLLTRLYTPLTMLANARLDIMSAVVSFQRVFEILDLVPLIKEPKSPKSLPAGGLDVTFSDVDFAYPSADQVSLASLEDVSVLDSRGGDEVLHSLNFTIPAGHTVALVGSSGAGKSTIASLLPRLYDVTSGSITISGVDVRDLSYETMRKTVGVVTQDGHVFHESIRENLSLAKPEAGDAELHEAIDGAQLHDVIASLPDGLDTIVGERGYRLSGGERQRLTIARMLLAAPDVVVLDEATSALDSTNEAAVQSALTRAMSGRTAMVIAHRLSTIRQADTILVVEAGRIVESGSHAELLAQSGRYAELYATQFAAT
ncbi:ABC transporter ATP-binding protein [Brevibacterium marinum]|uniref:ATP-binding cassette subfamily C protein n=1 Tax=Brevibacterium marinum TaxID=418643 RepID=A0A846RXD2_9MICO|nr:ABC transporter ATP-binding protein [Brevibacterium marinum]NJC56616.1 ATP-binding cassette subfamily C protein [Brevibacterium marinum]